jgi:PTH1 family peptidyl-tRNA hydrolase
MALDYFSKELLEKQNSLKISKQEKFNAIIVDTAFLSNASEWEKLLLVYPQTFMNNSGVAVQEILSFYKLGPSDIIVIHDEIDLPLGTVRVTEDSGAAGHNGVKSIIEQLGTTKFKRIRIGIESRIENRIPPTDVFVLEPFKEEELYLLPFTKISEKINEELLK